MVLIKKRLYERLIEKKANYEQMRASITPEFMESIKKEQLINFTYNSNALEGISLSFEETRDVIEEFYNR